MRTRYLIVFDVIFFVSVIMAFMKNTKLGFFALGGYVLFLVFAFVVLRENNS